MTVLPNFLVAGAAKCGTTSGYYLLRQHPEIFMSTPKEPDFFFGQIASIPTHGPGDGFQEVIRTFPEYGRLFASAEGKKAVGEASHTNLYCYKKTLPLIKRHLGDPRIIIFLRNPVDRAFSNHTALAMQGRETLSFEDALAEEPRRMAANWRPIWFYRDLGFYAHQVRAFMNGFSAVKVCLSDDLMKDPVSVAQELFRFLGVDPAFAPRADVRINPSGVPRFRFTKYVFRRERGWPHKLARGLAMLFMNEDRWISLRDRFKFRLLKRPVMRPETREMLRDAYREDILELQSLIGRDLNHWLNER